MKKKYTADELWKKFIDDFFAATSKEELLDIVKSVQKEHDEVDGYQPNYPDITNLTITAGSKYNFSEITNVSLEQLHSLSEAA